MSGQTFELDGDPAKFMGDEAVLLETVTGGTTGEWADRIHARNPTARDILLMAYLARHRTNPNLDWHQFIRTVAPYTISLAPADEPAVAPARKAPTKTAAARKPAARNSAATS
jgi:hypothetical protein